MTTRDEWERLAARCEAATGPDRELDEALSFAVYGASGVVQSWTLEKYAPDLVPCPWEPPGNYTASIDAIVALVERELPGWSYRIDQKLHFQENVGWIERCGAALLPPVPRPGADEPIRVTIHTAKCGSAPIALCAAFCRAAGEVSEATKEG